MRSLLYYKKNELFKINKEALWIVKYNLLQYKLVRFSI